MNAMKSIRREFPSLESKCYLNTAAEGIPPLAVEASLREYFADKLLGMDGRSLHFERESQARELAGRMLGLSGQEIGFCSCSAEAYNLLSSALDLREEDEVVMNDLDYPSGFTPWLVATRPHLRLWKSSGGELALDDLAPLLNSRTRLVQVSLVSFYNGWRLPWRPFIETVRQIAPEAVVSVDLTQALGRCALDCEGADILVSSTHKWVLGIHGGCIVGIPEKSAGRLTTKAGGWYHIRNAFDKDRFERADIKEGAKSYSVGMPSFAPIYALGASMRFLESIGIESIARHADSLTAKIYEGICEMGIRPLAPYNSACASGIVAFCHDSAERIHQSLRSQNVHIMHQVGRLRVAVHGYNTMDDIRRFLEALRGTLQ